jgi:hypothetical protein
MGWGIIARNGDSGSASAVAFSHDGATLVYCKAASVNSGVNVYQGGGDLYRVPYNGRMGGAATPVAGASDPAWSEFYPSFSADDRFLAFSRVPNAESSYDEPLAEIMVVPTAGGAPSRLTANDPPACLGRTSPGITNSWPKWSPEVRSAGGKTYYWLTFSSKRGDGTTPQLYITALVASESGIDSFPALYLWNQPEGEANHTPAWDQFQLIP